ncbi:MAG: phosphoadenylyl-sulfate reductase [bacterium]
MGSATNGKNRIPGSEASEILDSEFCLLNSGFSPEAIIRWTLDRFHPHAAIAASFQDAVLLHMASVILPDVRVFSLDTGRLPEETYAFAEALRTRLNIRIDWYFPQHSAIEKLERESGLYSFRESLEARKECCGIRKVEPLGRALTGLKAWITGLRREDGETRTELQVVEVDTAHGGILKINPLAHWTTVDIDAYVKKHGLPVNRLTEQGYPSIGCAPCTRAVEPGQPIRSGRWWWENPEHKECGLHGR